MKNIYVLILSLITFSCVDNQTNNESIIVSDAQNEDLIVLVEWSINQGARTSSYFLFSFVFLFFNLFYHLDILLIQESYFGMNKDIVFRGE
jgi:hypothetical protein